MPNAMAVVEEQEAFLQNARRERRAANASRDRRLQLAIEEREIAHARVNERLRQLGLNMSRAVHAFENGAPAGNGIIQDIGSDSEAVSLIFLSNIFLKLSVIACFLK